MSPIESSPPRDPIDAELQQMARDCGAMAQRLASLTSAMLGKGVQDPRPVLAARARSYLRARRLREKLLPAELFADPAWDILLDLYACEIEGNPVAVSSACIASSVPPTTALRWLGRLEELALVRRENDPTDSRRTFLHLTSAGRTGIERWLEQSAWPPRP